MVSIMTFPRTSTHRGSGSLSGCLTDTIVHVLFNPRYGSPFSLWEHTELELPRSETARRGYTSTIADRYMMERRFVFHTIHVVTFI